MRTKHRLSWFLNRINKKIYVNVINEMVKRFIENENIILNGVIQEIDIINKEMAYLLFDMQNVYKMEFRDRKRKRKMNDKKN